MPIDPLLVPTANDPTTRIMQRMAQLEARIEIQERRKDFMIQPFTAIGGSGALTANFTATGGFIAIMCNASLSASGAGTAVGTVSVNGHSWQALAATAWGAGTVGSGVVCQYIAANWLVIGTNAITVVVSGVATQAVVQGVVMEWAPSGS